MERAVNQLINKFLDTKDIDYVVAIDTDSLYLNFGPLVDKFCKGKTKAEITDFLANLGRETIEPFMTRKYEELAASQNAFKQAMKMKRENIGDKAIWTAKKRYMMNVMDSEGERYAVAKLKIMGLETARSSTPEICREALKQAISIIMNKDERALQDFIAAFQEQFNAAPFDEVAFPRGVNNLEKYSDDATIYKLRTPIAVKGALIFNKLLKDRNITKIEPIWSGDKVKFSYLRMPNPTHDTVIACHDFIPFDDIIPFIDYTTQFQKSFLEPLEAIINTIGWRSKEEESLESLGV
jgi:DNA polymerase elongation subunit (family B)